MAVMIELRLVSQNIHRCRLRAFALPGLRTGCSVHPSSVEWCTFDCCSSLEHRLLKLKKRSKNCENLTELNFS